MNLVRIIVFLGFLTGIAWAKVDLTFAPQIEVTNRETLTLADLATTRAADNELLADLARTQIHVTDESRSAGKAVLKSLDVLKLLKQRSQANEIYRKLDVRYNVPSQIEITFTRRFSEAEFKRKLANTLQMQCRECEIEITSVRGLERLNPESTEIDFAAVKLQPSVLITVVPNSNSSSSSNSSSNLKDTQPQYLSAQIKYLKPAWVAMHSLAYGTRIESGDVVMKMADVSMIKDPLPDRSQVVGALLQKSLSTGNLIQLSDLKREPVLKRGQLVKVLVGSDQFEVSVNAVAEENGFIGDTVKLKATETNKLLTGVVVEKGVVRVE